MDAAVCEYCRGQRAVVYCPPDSARLCLSCDVHVHSANALASRHVRSLICDRCLAQPAFTWCIDDGALLCHDCDWCAPSLHRRQPVNCYSGCPSSSDLLSLWSSVLNVNHLTNSPHQFHGSSDDVFEVYPVNSSPSLCPFQDATLDFAGNLVEGVHDNSDQGVMINANGFQHVGFVSISNHTGESSAVDYQDCGVSSTLDANYPQARNEAKMRYNEKKKSRAFGKNLKNGNRKVKSEKTKA
ncbi:putative transcription factor interactor and regulator Znf-B family [Dioscorea sansibarensis]